IALGTQGIGSFVLRSGQVRAKIRDLSARFHLDVDPDARVSTLSVGEQQRVEILKALYRDARVLILDEPTAVLTPQEAQDLFATLRQAVEMGLSIIFISHKLHEVMALADRVAVLRHGRLVATRTRAETNPDELVSLMVGTAVERHEYTPRTIGAPRLSLRNVSTPSTGTRFGLNNVSLTLHAGQIVGLAGVSGNGQAALSDVISGLIAPSGGDIDVAGQGIGEWSPRIALSHGIGRIPEDRHKTGTIADFDLTENAVLETYRDQFSQRGWIDWRGARAHAEALRETYDVRTAGVDSRIRLLSGGNMQKLILGRVLEQSPQIILANQPVRGLDIGAVTYVHRRLVEAAENG
ncbi:MAG: ATP-binding cassette domain-containing protein, partial [Pseudomonadota bacterium]|nr:ATP-binding cassette domain-containing protein [Pseudomonadota bacterium]